MGSLARRLSGTPLRSVGSFASGRSVASAISLAAALALSACSGDDTVAPLGANDAGNDATTPSGGDAAADARSSLLDGASAPPDATVDADAANAADAPDDANAARVDGRVADGAVDAAALDSGTDAAVADAAASDAESVVDAGPATFTNVYASVISVDCVVCHSGTTPTGALQMGTQGAAYTNLVNVTAAGPSCNGATVDGGPLVRVVPGDVADSLLVQKVSGTQPCGSQMPLDSDPLSPSLVHLIEDWIRAGAPNN